VYNFCAISHRIRTANSGSPFSTLITTTHARNTSPRSEMLWWWDGRGSPSSSAACATSHDTPPPWPASPASPLDSRHSRGISPYLLYAWPRWPLLGLDPLTQLNEVHEDFVEEFNVGILTGRALSGAWIHTRFPTRMSPPSS
jgi:hypothetical protein